MYQALNSVTVWQALRFALLVGVCAVPICLAVASANSEDKEWKDGLMFFAVVAQALLVLAFYSRAVH